MEHSITSWTVPVAAALMLFSGTALANRCGDGVLWPADGEQCDDGNLVDGDGCSSLCLTETPEPYCGDGNLDDGEACDDGNNVNGDGCSASCTIEPYCGDGNLDPGEQCDDGNNVNGDGCSEACEIEEIPSGEGCTPGYWKQSQHFDSWSGGYLPTTSFQAVFGTTAFSGMNLLQVLSQGGGGLAALGRHTVAALLNAAAGDVDYGMSIADVIAAFQAAYASGDYESLKDDFEYANESGCPLN